MDSLELCRKYKKEEYNQRVSCLVKVEYLRGINNEEIVFSFTKEIKNLLERVIYGLSNLKCSDYSNVVLLDSHSSATIEGCKTTVDSIKECLRGKNPSKDDLMVLNILKAQNTYKAIRNINDIVNVWRVLSSGVCGNLSKQGKRFRKDMVYVGSNSSIVHVPELPSRVESDMRLLIKFLESPKTDAILKGVICHYYIEYIHPMCDCNGRLSRALQNIVIRSEYHDVYKVPITSIINENLSGYYKSLKDSNVVCNIEHLGKCIDVSPFIEYMLVCFLMAIERSNSILNNKEKVILNAMKKRGVGSELTVKNACKILKESNESSVRDVLNGLSDKNILSKRKEGNKNIYRL